MPYKDREKHKSQHKKYMNQRYKDDSVFREQIKNSAALGRKAMKEWYIETKSKLKCKICPENHVSCIDFHHRDHSNKLFEVGDGMRRGLSKDKILSEMEKCDILCSNCHRKLHWKEDHGEQ